MALETTSRPIIKRLGLIFLTLWVAFLVGSALYGSWTQPQAQGQINLYQTNLTLEALEWDVPSDRYPDLKEQLFGKDPLKDAIKQYETVKASIVKTSPNLADSHLSDAPVVSSHSAGIENRDLQTRELLDRLNLRLGILAAVAGQNELAQQSWQAVIDAPFTSTIHRQNIQTAKILDPLWSQQTLSVSSDGPELIEDNLSGWFRYQALHQFYEIAANPQQLNQLEQNQQQQAEAAITRLFVAVGLPLLGSVVGIVLLILWGIKTWQQQGKSAPMLSSDPQKAQSPSSTLGVSVPWNFETFWTAVLLWFFAFFVVSLVIPLSLQIVFRGALSQTARGQSLIALANYSGLIIAGLSLLVWMTRSYVDNFFQWLPIKTQGRWPIWGLGGYVAALPLVLLISVINHRLLGDQGGGNPLLDIILQSHDLGTWFILLVMVSVLAPIFEEIVFRGFVLTSLTQYVPTSVAIALSATLFAVAHLNIGDLLPLVILGCVLGTVYTQSKNLLASMLLHSLWNGAQLIELLYLSGSQ